MKRLTDEIKNEMFAIANRTDSFQAQAFVNVPMDQHSYTWSHMISQHGDELETYKVRLENIYSETDVKEKTFQDFQNYFWNHRAFPVIFIRWTRYCFFNKDSLFSQARAKEMERLSERKTNCIRFT